MSPDDKIIHQYFDNRLSCLTIERDQNFNNK